jgi:cytoskeletal protein CcmA (bactofilin family)
MFRIKKGSGSDAGQPVATVRQEVPEEPIAKIPPPRRTMPIPARPLGSPNYPLDIGRRVADGAGGSLRLDAASGATRDKALMIGKDVRLKGEILACEKLTLEGQAEVAVTGCRSLHVGSTGIFRGTADVAEADIGGQFEGDLVSRERLTVRSTGRIIGKVRYTQITIEAGGQITGEVTRLEAETSAPEFAATQSQAAARAGMIAAKAEVGALTQPSGAGSDATLDRS